MQVSGTGLSLAAAGIQQAERQDLQGVQAALQSGDLAGAQQAFSTFKADFHVAHGGHNLQQTHIPLALKQDLQNLQSAFKSGDLAAAQQAFETFKQDFQQRSGKQPEPPVGGGPSPLATPAAGVDVTA